MARKIRFPLKLAEGAEVRTLDELREHFDLQAILEYYTSGKLLTWLEDRYLEGEAEAIRALDEDAPDFQQRLCEIFQVEYTGAGVDMEEIERRQERLKRLRTITDEAEYIQNIDSVAFDQEELADLLDEGVTKIYLCGEKFTVPASRKGVTYVGIKKPTVHISGTVPESLEELKIEFLDVSCDNLPTVQRVEPEAKSVESPASTEAVGIVERLKLKCGCHGERTPQLYFKEPVFLDGVRYDHVPVLSAGLFEELELRVGSKVNVHRVGDVIPSISVIKEGDGKKLKLPDTCPQCNGPLVINNKKLMCQNPNCKGNVVGKYLAFLDAIGVDGYGEAFIEELVKHIDPIFVGNVNELCLLTKDRLKEYGMTDKLSQEFPEKVAAGMAITPDYVILGAMGWPDIGPARAKELLKYYGGLDKFVSKFGDSSLTIYWHNAIGEVGLKSAKAISSDCLVWDKMRNELKQTVRYIKNITTDFREKIKVGHTGRKLSDAAVQLCRNLGMEIVDGNNFDILITVSKSHESKKMETARKKNLPVYLDEEFVAEFVKFSKK